FLGQHTLGGYATTIVVTENFCLHVPPNLDLAAAAPLLCAGITTYSPLRHWQVGPGQKVGIIGLGGLGHMAVKFARAFGAHVVLFTTSPAKVADGLHLGAHEVVLSHDVAAVNRHRQSFHFLLDTASDAHDLNLYLPLLKLDGTLTLVGAPEQPLPVTAFNLLLPRRQLAGSAIGGLAQTQEMLNFCSRHELVADIELIPIHLLNEAWERLLRQDVRYRFVIDMASLKA
ncbi:MAG TPA: zinc-binding dehydrogenase, partial [Verrucomicrobiae bacterium]